MNKEWCMYENHYFNNKNSSWEKIYNSRVCINLNCNRKHTLKRSNKLCPKNKNCLNIGTTCFLLHETNNFIYNCKYGKKCCDIKCNYKHPPDRETNICILNEKCQDALITCFLLHDLSKITPICKYNKDCINFMCEKRHSFYRCPPCPDGSMCFNFIAYGSNKCKLLHPKILQKLCKWDMYSECRTFGCAFVHNPLSTKDCPEGMQCQKRLLEDENRCLNKHPKFSKFIKIADKFIFE